MIAIAGWALLGAAVSFAAWSIGQTMFDVPPLRRVNYRGAPIVTGVGLLVPVSLSVLVAGGTLVAQIDRGVPMWSMLAVSSLVAASGFSLLGLFDDVAGQGQSGGFRGHLAELREGRLSSGLVKLVVGAALGVVVASMLPVVGLRGTGPITLGLEPRSATADIVALLRDGAVIALAANLANLFDRAPGRVIKVATVGFAVCAAVSRSVVLAAPAGGIGAGLGLLWADLRERCMVGDAGSNALGALVGMAALIAAPGSIARWLLAAALLAANVASERVSFSTVIDRVAPLRWLDRLGSLRPR